MCSLLEGSGTNRKKVGRKENKSKKYVSTLLVLLLKSTESKVFTPIMSLLLIFNMNSRLLMQNIRCFRGGCGAIVVSCLCRCMVELV